MKAYQLAKSYDFDCVNMDLIAGLPGESYEDFTASVDTAVALSPENITVHTLALKRSSELNASGTGVSDGNEAKKCSNMRGNSLTAVDIPPIICIDRASASAILRMSVGAGAAQRGFTMSL